MGDNPLSSEAVFSTLQKAHLLMSVDGCDNPLSSEAVFSTIKEVSAKEAIELV